MGGMCAKCRVWDFSRLAMAATGIGRNPDPAGWISARIGVVAQRSSLISAARVALRMAHLTCRNDRRSEFYGYKYGAWRGNEKVPVG